METGRRRSSACRPGKRAVSARRPGTPFAAIGGAHTTVIEAAMHMTSNTILARLIEAPSAAMLRAGCAALLVGLGACGGGDDGTLPRKQGATPAPMAQSAGSTLSVDGGASGNPTDLRVAGSANGDGFVVWRADGGSRYNLWANRYRAATGAWGEPVNIESSSAHVGIDFDVTADASGNAVVAWTKAGANGLLKMGARFDGGAGTWAKPVLLDDRYGPELHVAGNATGAVLVMYGSGAGRFLDPASGLWQPSATIAQPSGDSGYTSGRAVALDGSGNALAVFRSGRITQDWLGSNYFSRSTGSWGPLPSDDQVPGSHGDSYLYAVQLVASVNGNFLAAWQESFSADGIHAFISIARFASSTRTWRKGQIVVPMNAQDDVQFQRLGSNAGGHSFLLWTQGDGMRTTLKALPLDGDGMACSARQTIDSALGGGAARADLAVDPRGNAIAIWQQFEGGRPDDGSRSNIAISRFDGATGTWKRAELAETQPGQASSPRASTVGGQALLGWIQSENGANRVKVVLHPFAD
jgi:hypothetical protein